MNLQQLLDKTKEEFDKKFEMKNFSLYSKKHDIPATTTEIECLIRESQLAVIEEVKKMIKERGLHLGYKNDILEQLTIK